MIHELLQRAFRPRSERYREDPNRLKLDFGDTPEAAHAAQGLAEAVQEAELLVAEHARRRRTSRKARDESLPGLRGMSHRSDALHQGHADEDDGMPHKPLPGLRGMSHRSDAHKRMPHKRMPQRRVPHDPRVALAQFRGCHEPPPGDNGLGMMGALRAADEGAVRTQRQFGGRTGENVLRMGGKGVILAEAVFDDALTALPEEHVHTALATFSATANLPV